MKKLLKILLFILVLIVPIDKNYGQNNTPNDSIIDQATLKIYENPDESIAIGQSVFNDSKSSDRLKIRGLILISDGYSSKRDYQKALEYLMKATPLSVNLIDKSFEINIYNKIGYQYQQLRIFDKALNYLELAEKLCTDFSKDDFSYTLLLGNNYLIRGFIYKERLNCEVAVVYFNKGIDQYSKLNNSIVDANLSIANYNKGNCFIQLNNIEAAKTSFIASIAIARKIQANSLLAFSKKGLAEVFTLEKEHQKAIVVLKEAEAVSKNVGDLVLNKALYFYFYNNYQALNDWENYQKYHKLFITIQLEIKALERKSISQTLDQNQEEFIQKLSKKIPTFYFLIITICCLIFANFLFMFFNKNKSQKRLQKLQNDIEQLQKRKKTTK